MEPADQEFEPEPKSLKARVYERLDADMPSLREEYPDSWVAYDINGLIMPPEKDGWALFRKCQELGYKIGEYVIDTTAPEEIGEITETEILYW